MDPHHLRDVVVTALRLGGLAFVITCFFLIDRHPLSGVPAVLLILGGPLVALPISVLGRKALDRRADSGSAARVSTWVHYPLMLLLGCAVVQAFASVQAYPGPQTPLPANIGLLLLVPFALVAVLSVANLALQGLGAPMAVALSRRLAVGRLYAWTRNPMILGGLGTMVGASLWLRSWWLLAWTLLVLTPIMIAFVKVFEEKELEIRFGEAYRNYRSRTPLLWPRRPRP